MGFDLEYQVQTARHELSHALVAYALGCSGIEVKVFKKWTPVKLGTVKEGGGRRSMRVAGVCGQCMRHKHYSLFITAAPFTSPSYRIDEDDYAEFRDAVGEYRRLTSLAASSFRSFVIDPVGLLLDSAPALAILDRLAGPLAQVGKLRARDAGHFERFFPDTLDWPTLRVLCRTLREAAHDYPFDRK